jgi:hypothetical protein
MLHGKSSLKSLQKISLVEVIVQGNDVLNTEKISNFSLGVGRKENMESLISET